MKLAYLLILDRTIVAVNDFTADSQMEGLGNGGDKPAESSFLDKVKEVSKRTLRRVGITKSPQFDFSNAVIQMLLTPAASVISAAVDIVSANGDHQLVNGVLKFSSGPCRDQGEWSFSINMIDSQVQSLDKEHWKHVICFAELKYYQSIWTAALTVAIIQELKKSKVLRKKDFKQNVDKIADMIRKELETHQGKHDILTAKYVKLVENSMDSFLEEWFLPIAIAVAVLISFSIVVIIIAAALRK